MIYLDQFKLPSHVVEDSLLKMQGYMSDAGYTDNPYQIIARCQLFVCSSYVEGLSSAVIEALILGLPIIGTDCGGNKELLQNGKYGILVNNDVQTLFDGIYRTLLNTINYFELKENCRRRGEDFSYMKQVEDIQNLLLS